MSILITTQHQRKLFKNIFHQTADTIELKQKVYNIRYRVYCEEFNYESVESCPNKTGIR